MAIAQLFSILVVSASHMLYISIMYYMHQILIWTSFQSQNCVITWNVMPNFLLTIACCRKWIQWGWLVLVGKENGLYILQIMDTHPKDSSSSHQTHNQLKLPTQANTYHVNASLPWPHVQNIVTPKSALWNFRLRHVSSKRIAQMSKLYSSFDFDNNATSDICHLAKQRKLLKSLLWEPSLL